MANSESLPAQPDSYTSPWENFHPWGNSHTSSWVLTSRDPDEIKKEQSEAVLKKVESLLQLSPAEQLKYLSNIWENAMTDIWYAMSTGKDIFNAINGNDQFSPLIQMVANVADRSSNPNNENYNNPDYNSQDDINESIGYDRLTLPEQIPILENPSIEGMSEKELKTRLNNIDDYPTPPEYADEISYLYDLQIALNHTYFERNQSKLRKEFPSLSDKHNQLIKIASDAAISINFQQEYGDEGLFRYRASLDMISDNNGRVATMAEAQNGAPNKLDLDKDMLLYLETVHCRPWIKDAIESTLNLNLTEIPLSSQIQLLKYMTEADSTRYENLCDTLKNTPTILRKKLAEAFLSADFGPDFGDSLLTIANSDRFSPDQVADILISIDSCRASIKDITSLYSQVDNGAFFEQYSRAANERLTDALTVFREIAEHGSAKADLGWAGQTDFSYESAIEALNYERESLSIISGTIDDVISGKDGTFAEQVLSPNTDYDRSIYNFYSPDHGYVLLYTRPEGSSTFDPMIEYGKFRSKFAEQSNNAGIEASISFIVNPVDPFSLPNPYRPDHKKSRDPNYYDPSTMNKVSALRLDREGRAPNTPATDPDRSPIAKIGTISVDLAAIGDRADTPSGKIARLLSTGNKLREQSHGTNFNLNHNTRYFNQEAYGTASGFKDLVDYIQSNADILCLICPPSRGSLSFSSAARSARQTKQRQTRQSRPRYPVRPAA